MPSVEIELRHGTSAAVYAAGAAIVTGGVAFANEAKSTTISNPRLHRLIALHHRANEAADRFTDTVEEPVRKAFAAACNALPATPSVPHRIVATTYLNITGDEVRLSTASPGSTGVARRFITDPTWADMGDETWRQAQRELVALADGRDASVAAGEAAHQRKVKALQTRYNIAAIGQRSDQLDDREAMLWQAVMGTPAHSLADIAAKVAFADQTRCSEVADTVLAAIGADVHRLAAREG